MRILPSKAYEQLIGRSFVASSNNICMVGGEIGEGAMRIIWKYKPTKSDIEEFTQFFQSIFGSNLDITISIGRENEQADYNKWKEKIGYDNK